MKVQRGYKTKLIVNNRERAWCERCAEIAIFVYNWALADRQERYKAGNPTGYFDQKKRFNATKDELYPWIREAPYTVAETAFRNLDRAYLNFFKKVKGNGGVKRFPRFKSKKSPKIFAVRDVRIEYDRIKIPNLGWIRLAENGYLPTGKYPRNRVTLSEKAGDWYIGIQMEVEQEEQNDNSGVLGIDLGITSLVTCSDGTRFDNPQVLMKYEKQLARLHREQNRRKVGSSNRKKTVAKIAKLNAKIANTRRHIQHDISHHITTDIAPEVIVLETLNVAGMEQNSRMAKTIDDAGLRTLTNQIEYKAEWNGIEIVRADRWFPSSKTCSRCGHVKKILRRDSRIFHCEECGFEIDRDLNAAKNLATLGKPVSNGGLPVELSCCNDSL